MTAKPHNEWSINHLYRTVFCRTFYVFVDFTGSSRAYSPAKRTFVFAGQNKSPSWEKSFPGTYLDRYTIFHIFERVVNTPVELCFVRLRMRSGPMCIGRVVVMLRTGVVVTLTQRLSRISSRACCTAV